jgi:hypothetical protein
MHILPRIILRGSYKNRRNSILFPIFYKLNPNMGQYRPSWSEIKVWLEYHLPLVLKFNLCTPARILAEIDQLELDK